MIVSTDIEPMIWTSAKKIALRFFVVFFILYILFNPNGFLPHTEWISNFYLKPFFKIVPLFAKYILRMQKPVIVNIDTGSGDTTYDYIILLLIFILSAISALVWSAIDKKARNYNKLFYWICAIVRYYVAFTMFLYGIDKVIKLQFPFPSLYRLLEPYGNSSPMGLAWTYVGYSTGFNYFTGTAEILCGLLLLFRKTTTLGAVLGLVVAGNIMAINYCYDVPVKLVSTALVVMSLFLLARDFLRLINFFFLNKISPPSNIEPHRFKTTWKNRVLNGIKYLMIIYVATCNLQQAFAYLPLYGDDYVKPPLYGIYDTKVFVKNRDTLAPLTTDTLRWQKLIINFEGYARIRRMNDSSKSYHFITNVKNHTIAISTLADSAKRNIFTYIQKPDSTLLMKGKWGKDSLSIVLKRFDEHKFLLINRGFHFINEVPFNR